MPWLCKKCVLILEKRALFLCIYGLNSHLKCSFKGILKKKHQHVSLRALLLYIVHETFIEVPRNLPCPQNVLVALLLFYCIWKRLLVSLPFKRGFWLAISFEAHMIKPVKKLLKEMRNHDAVIPFGTKYSRMEQVKFFKDCLPHILLGPFLNTLSHLIVTWILEAGIRLDKELIIRLFKPCALTLKNEGRKDNIIHCFQSGQPCWEGTSLIIIVILFC